jgi:hypothetical protein
VAALENLVGVGRVVAYENNTSGVLVLNGGTIPANNLVFIVENGGTIQSTVFQAIFDKSTPGIPTYKDPAFPSLGYTQTVTDSNGSTRVINFMSPQEVTKAISITVHPLNGWDSGTVALIQAAVVAYINDFAIGALLSYFSFLPVITSLGTPIGGTPPTQVGTFSVTIFTLAGGTSDVQLNYNQAVTDTTSNVTVNVV